jgi:hypothetical protein
MDSVASVYAQELADVGIGCCTVLPRWVHGDRKGAVIDPASVAEVIATLIDLPAGEHPLRIFVHCRGTAKRHARVATVLPDVEDLLVDTVLPLPAVRGRHVMRSFPSRRAI